MDEAKTKKDVITLGYYSLHCIYQMKYRFRDVPHKNT